LADLIRRNQSLDGVRGVAVLLVLLHHHAYLNSGWLGVDLFFVLSGYFITTILRRSRTDVHFWQEFWIKRATRILPPLLLLLLVTGLTFRVSLIKVFCYLFSMGDVLAYARPFRPLDSLWSLAVEEHFYIVWPFAVRFLSRKTLLYSVVGAIIAEPILRALLSLRVTGWEATYYLTPFRVDGLCFGCLMALLLESERGRSLLRTWSAPCLVSVCALWMILRLSLGMSFTRTHPSIAYNSLAYSIISLGAFAIIAYLVSKPSSPVAKVLAWRGIVFCGAISYGFYLYQLLIRELVTTAFHLSYKRAFFLDLPITALAAWLSFRFYESPLIAWGKQQAQRLRSSQTSPLEATAHSSVTN
jgi:peptidoglycan/LPS O-acetylase OafA/YrhL